MKKTNKFFTAIVTAITLLFTALTSFSGINQVSAQPPDKPKPVYDPQPDSVYYLYDYYPTLSYSKKVL